MFFIFVGNFGDRYFGTDAPPDWSDEEVDEPSIWGNYWQRTNLLGDSGLFPSEDNMRTHSASVGLERASFKGQRCPEKSAENRTLILYSHLVGILKYIILSNVNGVVESCVMKYKIFLYVQYVIKSKYYILVLELWQSLTGMLLWKDIPSLKPCTVDDTTECEILHVP